MASIFAVLTLTNCEIHARLCLLHSPAVTGDGDGDGVWEAAAALYSTALGVPLIAMRPGEEESGTATRQSIAETTKSTGRG